LEHTKKSSSSSTKKWLIGCGIGCGAILLIVILLVMGGFFFVRNIVEGFKDTDALMDTLVEQHGEIQEYSPDPDGAIKPERLEAFLEAREVMAPAREEIEKSFRILEEGRDEETGDEESRSVFKRIKTGFGMIPQIADFYKSHVQSLLDVEMGMGEYYYIYTVVYFSWLGKSVLEGPDFQIRGDNEGYRYRDWDDQESEEVRQDITFRWLHRISLPMLQKQYEKLTAGDVPRIQNEWRKALQAEIEAMESNRYRLIWQDGLPEVIKKSLEPYRQRLEDSYSPLTNSLEIALERR
jgi:hypothetical protein